MTTGRPAPRPDVLQEAVRAFYEVSAAANVQMRQVLDALDLNDPTAGMLWMLDPAQPPTSMRQLARALGCDPSNVTLIADKLEHSGLAARHVNPRDARSRILSLTPAGLELRQRLLDGLIRVSPLAALSRTERAQLVLILRKLGAR